VPEAKTTRDTSLLMTSYTNTMGAGSPIFLGLAETPWREGRRVKERRKEKM
jgi:hypothetical protein